MWGSQNQKLAVFLLDSPGLHVLPLQDDTDGDDYAVVLQERVVESSGDDYVID